ncbi:MAG: glycosyltransferase family 1 protein [Clostridia bacterium]|nr:glycosyltransferase family 1 protein [Clostridia bacterium]
MIEMKNHSFLLEVLKEILKIQLNAKLLLVGDGPYKEAIQKKAEELKLQNDIIYYGVTDKVNEVLQVMDVFILPSLYEGVPLTVIEAAASGLKYVISDTINSHLAKNELELKLSLQLTAKEWAEKILNHTKEYNRMNQKELIENSGFDIKKQTLLLEKIYKDILQGE